MTDNLLLEASVCDLQGSSGLPLHRLVPCGPQRLMMLLGTGWGEAGDPAQRVRIHVDVGPDLPLLHRTALRAPPPSTPTPFQGLLSRELAGSSLTELGKPLWDRQVTLRFEGEGKVRLLVMEFFGARPNLCLLDDRSLVLGHLHASREGRRVVVGEPYPPLPPAPGLDPSAVDEARWRQLVADAGPDLPRRLRRAISGMGSALWQEIGNRAAAGTQSWELFRRWRDEAAVGRFEPRLYRAPGAEAVAGEPTPFVLPFPLPAPEGMEESAFDTIGPALDALLVRHDAVREIRARRDSLAAEVAREERRLRRLESRLAADLAREEQIEELIRLGNALLAGMNRAEVRGDRVLVPDPADAEAAPLSIAVDPRLSLQANVERIFHRARKAKRGRATVSRRLQEVRRRLPALQDAGSRLQSGGGLDELTRMEKELATQGVLRLVRRQRPRKAPGPAGRAPEVLPIRAYRSADGMEILLGRSGRENDRLTFRVAAPHDFWLHAQGFAGAHVVVRNPDRLPRLPRPTLEQAARLAAFHSKARGSGRVEVMFTQRRQVRKGRNLPPGAVRVKRHETIQVSPTSPFGEEV